MNILITGACGGMGREAGRLLQAQGHTVFALDIAGEAPSFCTQYFRVDLTSEEEVLAVFEALKGEGVQLDAIIHHAGIYDLNSLVEISQQDMARIWEINFLSAARINRIFLPLLSPGARIILTSSELAPLDPLPFTGLYGITKTAVEKYAFSLRMELQLLGIQVIVLRPGAVKTSLLDVSTSRLDDFCQNTKLYPCNAERFQKIVNSVEAKSVSPECIAALDLKILKKKHPRYIYSINRNPGLKLLNLLPARLQTAIIRKILK